MHIMKVNWRKNQPVRNTYKFKLKASMPHVKKPVGKTKFNQLTN